MYNYWHLLKEMGVTKVPKHNNPDKITFNNGVLDFGRKGALEHNVRAKIRNILNPAGQATGATAYTGQGISTKEKIIILPSSYKQLRKDLTLIIASIHAGNDSDEMKNRGLATIDELKNKGKMQSREEVQLQKFLRSNKSVICP